MTYSRPTAFVVVDLVSQANAFSRFVRGWTKEQILEWLNVYGEVESFYIPHGTTNPVYRFNSWFGLGVGFFLEGDQFTFIDDNTTWRPN